MTARAWPLIWVIVLAVAAAAVGGVASCLASCLDIENGGIATSPVADDAEDAVDAGASYVPRLGCYYTCEWAYERCIEWTGGGAGCYPNYVACMNECEE